MPQAKSAKPEQFFDPSLMNELEKEGSSLRWRSAIPHEISDKLIEEITLGQKE
jgi:hypothetical protein